MQIFYLTFIAAIINLIMGFIVFLDNPKKRQNILFSLVCLGISIWSLGVGLFRVVDLRYYMMLENSIYFAMSFTVVSFFIFSFYYPSKSLLRNKLFNFFVAFFCFVFIIISFIPGQVVESVEINQEIKLINFGPSYIFYSLMILVLLIWAFTNFVKKYYNSKNIDKLRLSYILGGCLSFILISAITNLILPSFGNANYNWVGPISSILLVGATTYTIVKHRLMGIRVVYSQIFIYLILSAFILAFYYFTIWLNQFLFSSFWSLDALLLGVIITIFFISIYNPVIRYSYRVADKLFYDGYNPKRAISKFTKELAKVIDIDSVYDLVKNEFKKVLHVDDIMVVVSDGYMQKTEKADYNNYSLNTKRIQDDFEKFDIILNTKRMIIKDEVRKNNDLLCELKRLNIEIVAPLGVHGDSLGVIIIGKKRDEDIFTEEDLEYIKLVSSQLAIVLENAILLSKLQENDKLVNNSKH